MGSKAGGARPQGRLTGQARPGAGRALSRTEDLIYVAVALVLAVLAGVVLVGAVAQFVSGSRLSGLHEQALPLLDRVLLVLMLVELLHTVGISLKEHTITPEPFLIVGLIAAIRRVLVITAEQGTPTAEEAVTFKLAMTELALLIGLVLALVGGLIALARLGPGAAARGEAGKPELSPPPDLAPDGEGRDRESPEARLLRG